MRTVATAALAVTLAACAGGPPTDAPAALVAIPSCVHACTVTVETVAAGGTGGAISSVVDESLDASLSLE